jgi:hypothetical protein
MTEWQTHEFMLQDIQQTHAYNTSVLRLIFSYLKHMHQYGNYKSEAIYA